MGKTKWLIFAYTMMVGLIPFLTRVCVFLVYKERKIDFLFNGIDFIMFGLVLNLYNISELVNRTDLDEKAIYIGFSAFLIIFSSLLLGFAYFIEIGNTEFSKTAILIGAILLNSTSSFFSFSIIKSNKYIHNGKN